MAIEFIHSLDVAGDLDVEGKFSVKSGGDSTQWDTAYSWGDHALAGYSTGGISTELDPVYTKERDDLRFNKMTHSTLLFDELEDYNKPSGYSTMIQPSSYQNPLSSHGYYHVLGRRDGEGGYGALLQNYNSHELFHGTTTKNTLDITWRNVWTSGDFAKQDVTEGATAHSWGNHADGGYAPKSHNHDTTYFKLSGGTITGGLLINNPASDKKIAFRRTNGKSLSIEHDTSQIYFYNETDSKAILNISNAGVITTGDGFTSTKGNTAYGWGNHADGGYLTSQDDDLPIGGGTLTGNLHLTDPTTAGTSSKVQFGTNTGWNNNIGIEAYWMILGCNQNEGFKFEDSTGNMLLQLNAANSSSGNGKLSATFAGALSAPGYNDSNWNTAHGWGNHAVAGYLKSAVTTETNLFLGDGGNASTHPGTSRVVFSGQVSAGSGALGMPTVDNSNSFLNINRHSGNYNSQLGFSSNSHMYYRSFSNTAINSSQAWHKVYTENVFANNSANWNTAYGWGNHADAGYTGDQTLPTDFVSAKSGGAFGGDISAPSFIGKLMGGATGAPDATIWCVSGQYTDWGIFYDENTPDVIQFKSGGTTTASIALDNGNINTSGTLTASGYNNSNWNTAYGWGNHASAGYLTRVTPVAPEVSSKIVGETIEVIITASKTTSIDNYLVFSSVGGGDYGLISVIPPDDFSATMSIIDNTFDAGGKTEYRVYAVKQGVYSAATATSQTFTVGTLEPLDMSVISLNTAHFIQWNPPTSKQKFIKKYNVYHHEHDTESSLTRSSASLIYTGLNTSFMRQETNTKFHQFWVEIETA